MRHKNKNIKAEAYPVPPVCDDPAGQELAELPPSVTIPSLFTEEELRWRERELAAATCRAEVTHHLEQALLALEAAILKCRAYFRGEGRS